MIASDAKELKELRSENSKLKRLLVRSKPEKRVMKELAKRKFRAHQRNTGLYRCLRKIFSHQNRSRAKFLGFLDQCRRAGITP
jgi:hypothetical protein